MRKKKILDWKPYGNPHLKAIDWNWNILEDVERHATIWCKTGHWSNGEEFYAVIGRNKKASIYWKKDEKTNSD